MLSYFELIKTGPGGRWAGAVKAWGRGHTRCWHLRQGRSSGLLASLPNCWPRPDCLGTQRRAFTTWGLGSKCSSPAELPCSPANLSHKGFLSIRFWWWGGERMLSIRYLKMWAGFWVHLGGGAGQESGACTDLCPGLPGTGPSLVVTAVVWCPWRMSAAWLEHTKTHCQLLKGRLALKSVLEFNGLLTESLPFYLSQYYSQSHRSPFYTFPHDISVEARDKEETNSLWLLFLIGQP